MELSVRYNGQWMVTRDRYNVQRGWTTTARCGKTDITARKASAETSTELSVRCNGQWVVCSNHKNSKLRDRERCIFRERERKRFSVS